MIIQGKGVHGAGRGHKMKVPTVNVEFIAPNKKAVQTELSKGVYAGWFRYETHQFPAAINWGPRPTFHEEEPIMEAFLLDFDLNVDLHGAEFVIEILDFVRDVKAFDSKEELVEQIKKDVQEVRSICKQAL